MFQSLYSPAVAESLTVVLVGLEPESTSLSLSFLLGQDYHVFRVAVPQRVGYTEITLQENGYSVERGAMRKDFDEVSSFVAALQQEDLIQTGNTSNWMDPLRLKLASSSIRRGLRLLVPDGLRGLIENSALLSTLADQADFVFVAGPVNASIPEKEQSLLKTLISRSNGFLAIFTDDQTTPPAPASGWNQSMGVSMLPPIFTSSVANQVRSSEILNRLTSENSELRLALIETRKRVQVESALLLLEDSLVRQVSQFRNRKRLMMGGLVNRPDEDQHLRAISEELRTRLQEDVESLRRKIEESAKLALLNEGAAYQILKQTMDSIAPMDLEQVNKGNIIQLSLTDEAAGKFRNVLIELGHNRLNDDLRLVHETLDNTNEELSRRLGETTGSILRLPIDFLGRDIIGSSPRAFLGIDLGVRLYRQAKIYQLRLIFGVEQNIAGLDIAMQKTVLQCQFQRGGDLDSHVQNVQLRHALIQLNAPVQASLVGQLHHQIFAFFKFIERVNVNDVCVVQGGARAGFAIKCRERPGVVRQFGLHHFHGHFALQRGIEGAIHRAHAAGCNEGSQFELPQLHRRHDLIAALRARGHGERFQVRGNKHLGSAPGTGDHAQLLPFVCGFGCHCLYTSILRSENKVRCCNLTKPSAWCLLMTVS